MRRNGAASRFYPGEGVVPSVIRQGSGPGVAGNYRRPPLTNSGSHSCACTLAIHHLTAGDQLPPGSHRPGSFAGPRALPCKA